MCGRLQKVRQEDLQIGTQTDSPTGTQTDGQTVEKTSRQEGSDKGLGRKDRQKQEIEKEGVRSRGDWQRLRDRESSEDKHKMSMQMDKHA